MGKYLLKRILYSIFSVICVMIIMMVLLYNLKDRNAVISGDSQITKLAGNDRDYYKATLLEKYDYIELQEYGSFLKDNYSKTVLPGELSLAATIPLNPDPAYASANESDEVKLAREYIAKFKTYCDQNGFEIVYKKAEVDRNGNVKSGYEPMVWATKDSSPFVRLWHFFQNLFKVQTTHDVENICKENNLTYETGYYLICDINEWENYNKYWGGFDFQLVKDPTNSDYKNNVIAYKLDMGVFEDQLTNGKFEWNIVYYDAETATSTKIFETNQVIEAEGQYRFLATAAFTKNVDSTNKANPKNAEFTLTAKPLKGGPSTRLT
ncbi:MAG: hypothetical protein MJ236_06480, partial [Clostridia bacterium]|nr:hypothetical protein [Clostridia bacterium]